MRKWRWSKSVAIVVIVSLLGTSACTSVTPVALPPMQGQVPPLKVGDHVRATTRGGEQLRFKVTAVENEALSGAGLRLSYRDIELLELEQFDRGKTAALTAVVTVVLLIIAAGQATRGYTEILNNSEP